MHTPIDQNAIDQKIHNFMARKSLARTLSETIAERFTPALKSDKHSSLTGIAYEQLDWHQTEGVANSTMQKAL